MKHLILVLLAAAISANAQFVSFGFKVGAPILDAIPKDRYSSFDKLSTGRWTGGPSVEFRLPFRFALEVNALFRGFRLQGATPIAADSGMPAQLYLSKREVKAWDFPFLLKYRFLQGPVRPFVSAGVSVTHQTEDYTFNRCTGSEFCVPPSVQNPVEKFEYSLNRRGLIAGGGVEVGWGRVKIAPEFRYTRLQNLATNQASILVGVTF